MANDYIYITNSNNKRKMDEEWSSSKTFDTESLYGESIGDAVH